MTFLLVLRQPRPGLVFRLDLRSECRNARLPGGELTFERWFWSVRALRRELESIDAIEEPAQCLEMLPSKQALELGVDRDFLGSLRPPDGPEPVGERLSE